MTAFELEDRGVSPRSVVPVAPEPIVALGDPLGGVGDIANYGSSEVYDLEEAFLTADDEELADFGRTPLRESETPVLA